MINTMEFHINTDKNKCQVIGPKSEVFATFPTRRECRLWITNYFLEREIEEYFFVDIRPTNAAALYEEAA